MIIIAARAVLTFACLMIIGSLMMLIWVRPGTGEFVITTVTLVLGGLLLAVAVLILRAVYAKDHTIHISDDPAIAEVEKTPGGSPPEQETLRTRQGRTKEET